MIVVLDRAKPQQATDGETNEPIRAANLMIAVVWNADCTVMLPDDSSRSISH